MQWKKWKNSINSMNNIQEKYNNKSNNGANHLLQKIIKSCTSFVNLNFMKSQNTLDSVFFHHISLRNSLLSRTFNTQSNILRISQKSCKASFLLLIFFAGFFYLSHANELDSEFNNFSNKKIPSQIKEPEENIVNAKDVQVKEKDGILQSNEQEVIDLFGKNDIEEPIDYAHCAQYYKQASVNVGNGIYAIRLKSGEIIGYNRTRPNAKNIIKYDPFVGLFLVKSQLSNKYAYELSDIDDYATSRELASTGIKGAQAGRFQSHQSGFLRYAQFSAPTQKNGVISNICYKIYGLSVGDNGFIEKKYIDRFLAQDKPYYGDIGVRFEVLDEETATFGVQFADPFFPNNPFKRGDILISINDIAPKNWAELELLIADLPLNETAYIKIRRNDEVRNTQVKVGKKYGGMLLADSFLERFNLGISNNFVVERAPSSGAFSKLKKGDKILFINNIDMRQFKPRNTHERNQLFQELFTRIQGNQVDFLEKKAIEQDKKKHLQYGSKDILEQFQSKDSTQDRKNSFYRKMSENIDEFMNGEISTRGSIPSLSTQPNTNDLHSFRGDGILRDSGTQSMRTIYDMYDSGEESVKKSQKERIKDYEELVEYGGDMSFLIDRQGFQFRVPLE